MKDMKVYICPECDAELMAETGAEIPRCPFCGNSGLEEDTAEGKQQPDYIVPFRITREDAQAGYRSRIKPISFYPSVFTGKARVEEIRGVYVPLRLYSGKTEGRIVYEAADVEIIQNGKARERYLNLYEVIREGEQNFEGIPAYASVQLSDTVMNSMEPLTVGEHIPFTPSALAGYPFEADEADENVHARQTEERIRSAFRGKVNETVDHSGIEIREEDIRIAEQNTEHLLFPVWLLPVEWNKKIYLFAVNGRNGEMYYEFPVSETKKRGFFIGVLAVLLIILYLIMRNWLYAAVCSFMLAYICSVGVMTAMRPSRKKKKNTLYAGGELHLTAEEERMTGRKTTTTRFS